MPSKPTFFAQAVSQHREDNGDCTTGTATVTSGCIILADVWIIHVPVQEDDAPTRVSSAVARYRRYTFLEAAMFETLGEHRSVRAIKMAVRFFPNPSHEYLPCDDIPELQAISVVF